MEKRTVRFTETATLERVRKPDLVYEAGSVHDLRVDRAQRWVKRGKAVFVTEAEAVQEAAPQRPVEIPAAEYDRIAADLVAGKCEIDYAVPLMAEHYKTDETVIRGELAARIERLKAPGLIEVTNLESAAPEFIKESTDGNAVDGASNVGGQNGGGAGVGAQHVAGRGRGGARGRRSGSGRQSNA